MTLNFYVSYLVPVSPEKVQEIEQKISWIERTISEALTLDPSADRRGAELAVSRLRAQMEPERRREPATMRSEATIRLSDLAPGGRIVIWECPRCYKVVARLPHGGEASMLPQCQCGAEVHKEELPMSLDLYRMRTRRTDGVEFQVKPHV